MFLALGLMARFSTVLTFCLKSLPMCLQHWALLASASRIFHKQRLSSDASLPALFVFSFFIEISHLLSGGWGFFGPDTKFFPAPPLAVQSLVVEVSCAAQLFYHFVFLLFFASNFPLYVSTRLESKATIFSLRSHVYRDCFLVSAPFQRLNLIICI